MAIPRIRPISATVPPHQLHGGQPPDYGHPPPQPRERRVTNNHRTGVRHSPAHHSLPKRPPTLGATPQIGRATRRRDPRPEHQERQTPTPGGHHNAPGSHRGHTASQHRTPKQAAGAPRLTTRTCQGGPPVYAGPDILHGGSAQRGHQIPSPAPPGPPRRPTPRSTASNKGMCATWRLAHVLPHGGHDSPLALLWGQYRRPSRHGLCQTRSTPPTQSNTQPPTPGPRSGSHTH